MFTGFIDWKRILQHAADICENKYDVSLDIDEDILKEIEVQVNKTLTQLNMSTMPNVAKVAGHVAFWIRKLKPVTHAEDSSHKMLTINEIIGILVGMGICFQYFDDTLKHPLHTPPFRVMEDWAMSLRTHSHSPHGCALAFEFFASSH